MRYSELLKTAIEKSGLKLEKIAYQVEKITGSRPTKTYLSKLQNGKTSPASDKLNEALASTLSIDSLEFQAAAYLEKIPQAVLEKLRNIS